VVELADVFEQSPDGICARKVYGAMRETRLGSVVTHSGGGLSPPCYRHAGSGSRGCPRGAETHSTRPADDDDVLPGK
jgi:hypothetical protein